MVRSRCTGTGTGAVHSMRYHTEEDFSATVGAIFHSAKEPARAFFFLQSPPSSSGYLPATTYRLPPTRVVLSILNPSARLHASLINETSMPIAPSQLLCHLQTSPALNTRIATTCEHATPPKSSSSLAARPKKSNQSFVLYLPTVNLRKEHNPAFALACHIANHLNVPLIVLAVVLDDHSMPSKPHSQEQRSVANQNPKQQVVMTSRRLAFILEALSESCKQWSDHGAGVAIRIHGPTSRSPDHLTLSSRAMAVVTDEPFVNPFLAFVQRVEKTCAMNTVPCFRVDGSTTVPPCSVLKRKQHGSNRNDDLIYYTGVPSKAWIWQKQTESLRMGQVQAAMNGEFDAPPLSTRVDDDDFFIDESVAEEEKSQADPEKGESDILPPTTFPLLWRDREKEAPGSRPWTVSELEELFHAGNIKTWSLNWHGADSTVKPCPQTIGTSRKGMQRWNNFVRDRKGLVYYAKRR